MKHRSRRKAKREAVSVGQKKLMPAIASTADKAARETIRKRPKTHKKTASAVQKSAGYAEASIPDPAAIPFPPRKPKKGVNT